jgi:hypothetical protein
MCAPQSTQACYTGPPNTDGVGICKSGLQTCALDGGWGPCLGEQTPQPKTCASTTDFGCDKLPCVDWAYGYGSSTSSEQLRALTLDPSDGSILIVGDFNGGPIQIGTTTLTTTSPNGNVFVARISPSGNPVWAKSYGPTYGLAITADSSSNVYVGGACADQTVVGGDSLTKGQFIMKLDKNGVPQWAQTVATDTPCMNPMGCPNNEVRPGISSLAIATDGDLLVAGSFGFTLGFGVDTTMANVITGFVAKVSSNDGTGTTKTTSGTHWTQLVSTNVTSSSNNGIGPRIASDGNGFVYVATETAGIELDVYDVMGGKQAGQTFQATTQTLQAIAVSSVGAIALVGQMQGTFTFMNPGATLSSASPQGDGFVIQLTRASSSSSLPFVYNWGKTFGVQGAALGVGYDANNNARLIGWFTNTLDFGVGTLNAGVNRMMLLAEISGSDGTAKWTKGWVYPGPDTFVHLAVAPSGDSFVGGTLEMPSFDLGTGNLISSTDAGVDAGVASAAWLGRFGP